MPDFFNVERLPEVLQEQVRGPGEGLANGGANLLQQAHAMRRGQTATPGRGPRGVSPLVKNVLDAKKAVGTALGLGDEDSEALNDAEQNPAISPQQYENLARERLKGKKTSYIAPGQTGPTEGGGSMTFKQQGAEGEEGHRRLAAGLGKQDSRRALGTLRAGDQLATDLTPGQASDTVSFQERPGQAIPQNQVSQFIDTYKDQVSPETYKRMQAGLNGGMNLSQLSELGQRDIQAQTQAKTHADATAAHQEAMKTKQAKDLQGEYEKSLTRLPKEIDRLTSAVKQGSDDPVEVARNQQDLKDAQDELARVKAAHKDLTTTSAKGAQPPPGHPQNPVRTSGPDEASKYPSGTHFIDPETGQVWKVN